MTVDLHTCDSEPIHIPGAIQPHGALLALDAALTIHQASRNVPAFLDKPVEALLGASLASADIGDHALASIQQAVADGTTDLLGALRLRAGALEGTLAPHSEGFLLELEHPLPDAPDPSSFAVASQRVITRLRGSTSVEEVIDRAVEEVKRMLGYDRVMAYRFAPDGHGEVIAERREPHLEPFLGLHYPASDIPKQARRLYALSPIRLIADVQYEPVPLVPMVQGQAPVDLSFAHLRSVSPIHCEYLANMGVRASMSISVLVEGSLWGLIACHHYRPRRQPPSHRMAAQLLSGVVGMLVEQMSRRAYDNRRRDAYKGVRSLVQECAASEDVLRGLAAQGEQLCALFEADGAAISQDARIVCLGKTPARAWLAEMVPWLKSHGVRKPLATDCLRELYPKASEVDDTACGALVASYHPTRNGFVVLFRGEQRREVTWGGDPNKAVTYESGPNGPRLTPRGSFALWRELSAGRSRPWSPVECEIAADLVHELAELMLVWSNARDQARDLVVAMVSHDLRTPLSAIMMAAEALKLKDSNEGIASRISSSSGRMRGLIDQLMDLSQIQSGKGLGISKRAADFHALVRRIVDEAGYAHPGLLVECDLQGDPMVACDVQRCEQVVSNLVGNARHHGDPARAISVAIRDEGEGVRLDVHNWGAPIPESIRVTLFSPYQGPARRATRASGGLGLGLYITRAIVREHEGRIAVDSSEAAGTRFSVWLPRT